MIQKAIQLSCRKNPGVIIRAIPGHFATSHAHTNYYIDITEPKLSHEMGREAAITLSKDFAYTQVVDTIAALDGSELISAFLARHLTRDEATMINGKKNIYVIPPESNASGQLIFRDNTQPMIRGKYVLIMIDAIVSGQSARRAVECVTYYGGKVAGIAAIFSTLEEIDGIRICHLFGRYDLPDYQTAEYHQCALCQAGEKLDGLANCYGYSAL